MAKKDVPITYRKSFMAKYILSDDRCKNVYTILKNKLLSIKGAKSRISWFYDAFNVGRINVAKLSIRGKYVALYLNLDTKDYPINIYHQENVEDRRRFKDTCFKIHVKSNRTVKYAFKLIDDVIKNNNLKTLDVMPNENYYLDYEEEAPLIARGLIKLEPKKNEKFVYDYDEYIEVDNFNKKEIKENEEINQIRFVNDSKVFVKERKSFEAKLIQSNKEIQDYYSKIKNAFLSFTKVKSRISWKYEAFSVGRMKLAKIQIRGKSIVLYLALDPTKYDLKKMKLENQESNPLFKDTPIVIRIRTIERLNEALELIKDLKKRFLLDEGFIKEKHDFIYEYQDNKTLQKQGLIKVFAKFGDYSNEIEAQIGKNIQSKKNNNFPVYKDEKRLVLTIDENNNFIERVENVRTTLEGNKEIVYLDTINHYFNDGDTVDLKALKEKNIIEYDTNFFKVVYRGGEFKKKIKIIASSSSPIVEKILEDNGSEYIIDSFED